MLHSGSKDPKSKERRRKFKPSLRLNLMGKYNFPNSNVCLSDFLLTTWLERDLKRQVRWISMLLWNIASVAWIFCTSWQCLLVLKIRSLTILGSSTVLFSVLVYGVKIPHGKKNSAKVQRLWTPGVAYQLRSTFRFNLCRINEDPFVLFRKTRTD